MGSSNRCHGLKFALAFVAVVLWGPSLRGDDLGNVGLFAKWSKVEIDLIGPVSDALANDPNPFEIEVTVHFSGPAGTYSVPAFFDGDGTGGEIGNLWRVRFSPDRSGLWAFSTTSDEATLAGHQGSFEVYEHDSCAAYEPGDLPDLQCHGRLSWTGEHYLKFADGPFWLKGGMDDPEDFLAPGVTVGFPGKTAAIDYLADHGINSLYFLTHNVGGDHDNVSPWSIDSDHFALARLAEWEETLSYLQSRGIVLHFVLEDDSGWTGFNRSLYYREMVARFGHHNGLIWNVSEEYNENYSSSDAKQFAQAISDLDPYEHPLTVHQQGGLSNWTPFLGDDRFDLTSFQTSNAPQNAAAVQWFRDVEQSGRIVPVSFDEVDSQGGGDRHVVWSIYMGGANYEWHVKPLEDYRDHETDLDDLTRARRFMEELPFWEMRPSNDLLVAGSGYVFAKVGEVYTAYLPTGGALEIDVTAGTGLFDVVWFNPRDESRLSAGVIAGGGIVSLLAPDTNDWVLLLRTVENVAPQAFDQSVVTPMETALQISLAHEDTDGPGPLVFTVTQTPLSGSLTDDDGDELLVYTPDAAFAGEDSFLWHLDDGLDLSVVATVTVHVHDPTNTAPLAEDPTITTDEDSGVPLVLSATDGDGDPLVFELESSPQHGTLTGTPPWLHYAPQADFHGEDAFTFVVRDGRGGSDVGTVSVTVLPVADRPLAHGRGLSTYPDTTLDLTLQATDADGDLLTYRVLTPPSAGTLLGENGSPHLNYVPAPGFHGVDRFVFRAYDGRLRSNKATVLVTVTEATALLWDDFERPDDTTLGQGWVEFEAGNTSAAIEDGKLSFAATSDATDRPLVRRSFPRPAAGTLLWDFEFDWLRAGQEGTYRLFMQLGDGSLMTPDDQRIGVGPSLVWTVVDGDHERLAYRSAGSTHGLATVRGAAALRVRVDLDASTYEVRVDGSVVGSTVPFEQPTALDTVRFFTDNVNHENFTGRTFDELRIRTAAVGGVPLSILLDRTQIYWPVVGGELGYDVVRGDLARLRGGRGEFSAAVDECLANDLPDTRLAFHEGPPSGDAWWFLVRAVGSSVPASYDTLQFPANGQVESRDVGIEASPLSCP